MTSEIRAPSVEDEAFADELVSPDASIQGIAPVSSSHVLSGRRRLDDHGASRAITLR